MNVQVSAPVETSRARIKQRLEHEGWFLARHGSAHDIYRHAAIAGILTLPRHRRLSPAVARSVAKKAGWSDEQGDSQCPDTRPLSMEKQALTV